MVKSKAKKSKKEKKTTKPASKSTKGAGISNEEIENFVEEKVCLTELEMAKLDGGDARRRLQSALIDKTRLQQEILTVKYREDMAALKALLRNHEASRREITSGYNEVLASIEVRLGIKMSECTVADDGAVTQQADIE